MGVKGRSRSAEEILAILPFRIGESVWWNNPFKGRMEGEFLGFAPGGLTHAKVLVTAGDIRHVTLVVCEPVAKRAYLVTPVKDLPCFVEQAAGTRRV